MAEKKKRHISRALVSLSPSTYELVNKLGEEANIATSQLLGEMIEQAVPAFEAMLEAVRQAKRNQAEAYDTLHRALIEAQQKASGLQLDLIEHKQGHESLKLRKRSSDGTLEHSTLDREE